MVSDGFGQAMIKLVKGGLVYRIQRKNNLEYFLKLSMGWLRVTTFLFP
ncbi:hypothetical protein UYSO10_5002 [Kosakonia radicincitans]|nr:hypothetical protein UYSO10_5002 [Kosakonia radicincitans]